MVIAFQMTFGQIVLILYCVCGQKLFCEIKEEQIRNMIFRLWTDLFG